jgi:capsule polysaccharide export protein KpsC/LpsZ
MFLGLHFFLSKIHSLSHLMLNFVVTKKRLHLDAERRQICGEASPGELVKVDDILLPVLFVELHFLRSISYGQQFVNEFDNDEANNG